jgi:large subunit ribosomal protein L25
MSTTTQMAATARSRAGKGTARAARREGQVPAVIYGGKEPPVTITLEERALVKQLHRPGFFTHLFDIQVEGVTHKALARDVQFHPVTDRPVHVDFLRVTGASRITVQVPVLFVDQEKSPGLKLGGRLNIVHHQIEVYCRADAIPEHIAVSLAGMNINDSVHMKSLALPEGVTPTDASDFTVASLAAPGGGAEAAS